MGQIRKVRESDKAYILGYCKNTFSWGDYIHYVWDDWILNGDFLAYEDCVLESATVTPFSTVSSTASLTQILHPVGICHVHKSNEQLWIEGIRVHPKYRRHGVATSLVNAAEKLTFSNNYNDKLQGVSDFSATSRMLVDVKNTSSLEMISLLGYQKINTWAYYKLKPQLCAFDEICTVDVFQNNIDFSVYPYYVDSWRWFQTNRTMMDKLASKNMIAVVTSSSHDDDATVTTIHPLEKNHNLTVSLSAISESVEGNCMTLYATLYPGIDNHVKVMIKYLSDLAARHSCEHICIFTQQDVLPLCDGLEKSYSFHLVEKPLS